MVAALSTKPSTPNRIRPPLIPSEKHNGALEAKPRTKEITSRYLSSPSPSSSRTQLRTTSTLPTASLPKRSLSANRVRSQNVSSTTTRSLPVAFQGQSFSFQSTRAKSNPPTPTPDRRKPPMKLMAKTQMPNSVTRSLDCSAERKDSILVAIRAMRHSGVFDSEKVKRAAFDAEDLCLSSDSDSLSSGGSREIKVPLQGRPKPKGVVAPARFRLDSGSPKKVAPLVSPSMKRMESPLRTRSGAVHPVNAPSVLNFAAEARRGKKGEGRIEEAHMLRLLHNRYLQWRCVNAQSDAVLALQRQNVEESLYNTSIKLSKMRDSVALKRMEIQFLTQDIKLISILKGQMIYLEDWSLMDREHHNSLSGMIGALKASTLRLPIVGGARADIQELHGAIGSAIDVMQAMGTSICSLLSKVEVTNALLSEVVKTVALEQTLLEQSKDLLSTVAVMHVKQCSLQGHIIQLNRRTNLMQL